MLGRVGAPASTISLRGAPEEPAARGWRRAGVPACACVRGGCLGVRGAACARRRVRGALRVPALAPAPAPARRGAAGSTAGTRGFHFGEEGRSPARRLPPPRRRGDAAPSVPCLPAAPRLRAAASGVASPAGQGGGHGGCRPRGSRLRADYERAARGGPRASRHVEPDGAARRLPGHYEQWPSYTTKR